ncbi:hypothetical protein N8525_03320 [Verrucomicrobiales bacterium]|nr:hypothetical protein [Verrucomicrobiales bacterium]
MIDTILVSLVLLAAIIYLTRLALAKRGKGACASSTCGDQCQMSKARKDD